jgi:hypothetical protein
MVVFCFVFCLHATQASAHGSDTEFGLRLGAVILDAFADREGHYDHGHQGYRSDYRAPRITYRVEGHFYRSEHRSYRSHRYVERRHVRRGRHHPTPNNREYNHWHH